MPNDYVFLPALLALGAVTTYEDIKSGKIRNIWILAGILYAVVVYLFFSPFSAPEKEIIYLNILISILVSYLLWKKGLWAAGDAKLFIVYALLIPPAHYKNVYLSYFPAFNLLFNIFFPVTLALFFRSLWDFISKLPATQLRGLLLKRLQRGKGEIVINFCGFSGIFLLYRIISARLQENYYVFFENNRVFIFIVTLLIYKPLTSVFIRRKIGVFVVLGVAVIYVIYKSIVSTEMYFWQIAQAMGMALLLMSAFAVFRKVTDYYIERAQLKTWPFAVWMFLGMLITWFNIF